LPKAAGPFFLFHDTPHKGRACKDMRHAARHSPAASPASPRTNAKTPRFLACATKQEDEPSDPENNGAHAGKEKSQWSARALVEHPL
jgi:hypothetical protein